MNLINYLKEKNDLIEENAAIRKAKKQVEHKNNVFNEKILEISEKYIRLLEQKSEQFDLYIKYRDESVKLADKNREQKKEIALLKEEIKRLKENGK